MMHFSNTIVCHCFVMLVLPISSVNVFVLLLSDLEVMAREIVDSKLR